MSVQPDPSVIGGVPRAPFVQLPDPVRLFDLRARRFAFLAGSSRIGPYLTFLAELTGAMARLARSLPAPAPIPQDRLAALRAAAMPPIDRNALAGSPELDATLAALCDAALEIEMPESARAALAAVIAAEAGDRRWLLANVLADTIPEDSVAPHLFAAAAVQLHLSRLAAALPAAGLVPVGVGTCPACGGRPATSSVVTVGDIDSVRYATCGCCTTQWNEVRVKCLCCGSTKGISYRSVETAEATVKAEVCSECKSWVKILYQVKNQSLDPIADDVGSLGLDLLMKDTGLRRGGFDPFLVGYG